MMTEIFTETSHSCSLKSATLLFKMTYKISHIGIELVLIRLGQGS